MFWKKPKPASEMIVHDSSDLRDAYRYDFSDGQSLTIEFKGKKIPASNISAGGIAFENQGFEPLESGPVRFTPDIPNYTGDTFFSAELRILTIDDENICHCIFEDCSLEQHELIHKYVLELQKNDLAR